MTKRITPLLRFLRAMSVEQQKEFAATCGTTRGYLYQIAGQPRPNPQLRLAFALVKESRRVGRKLMEKPLTLEDLLVGVDDDDSDDPPSSPEPR